MSAIRVGLILAGLLSAVNLARADDGDFNDESELTGRSGAVPLQEFEPEYVNIPGLKERYGIQFDRNHALPVNTQFVMEQIIEPDHGIYRNMTLLTDPRTNVSPNWLLFVTMEGCAFCKQLKPVVDVLARQFHNPENGQQNYIVASIDCSQEDSLFMCQYMHITRLPKFIVLRPEAKNRFFQFPLAYRKSPQNLYKFATEFWPEAYTQFEFVVSENVDDWQEWKHYFTTNLQDLMEEANGFFADYGFIWWSYWQLFIGAMFMLFGPFFMCWQTYKTYHWMQKVKSEQSQGKTIEEDPDFEVDDSVPENSPAPVQEGQPEESKSAQRSTKKEGKKNKKSPSKPKKD